MGAQALDPIVRPGGYAVAGTLSQRRAFRCHTNEFETNEEDFFETRGCSRGVSSPGCGLVVSCAGVSWVSVILRHGGAHSST